LAYAFPNFEQRLLCIQARLQALSILGVHRISNFSQLFRTKTAFVAKMDCLCIKKYVRNESLRSKNFSGFPKIWKKKTKKIEKNSVYFEEKKTKKKCLQAPKN